MGIPTGLLKGARDQRSPLQNLQSVIREFKWNHDGNGNGNVLNKSFNEQNNGCVRVL